MTWRGFQEASDAGLVRLFGERRVLPEPELPSGSRPDHVVLTRRGSRLEAVLDSKAKAALTHSDVTQLLRYDDELRPTKTLGFIVRETTTISGSVAARIDDEGIAVFVHGDDDDGDDDMGHAVGAGMVGLGAGTVAYAIAKSNGSRNPEAWAIGVGLLAAILVGR